MSRRTKILIGFILIVAVLILLYWLFLRPKYLPPPGPVSPAANVNAAPLAPLALPPVSVPPVAPAVEVPSGEKLKSDLGRLAAAFAERFGSYSNQGNFENLLDLKPLMTETMQDWVDDFITKSKAGGRDALVYFGVTTKAISTSIVELDEDNGAARITVGTQKREAQGTMTDNVKIYYQDLDLAFKKVGNEWKVDEAVWK